MNYDGKKPLFEKVSLRLDGWQERRGDLGGGARAACHHQGRQHLCSKFPWTDAPSWGEGDEMAGRNEIRWLAGIALRLDGW